MHRFRISKQERSYVCAVFGSTAAILALLDGLDQASPFVAGLRVGVEELM